MAKRHIPISFAKVIEETKSDSPRAAILVGASIVEYALTELIQACLRPARTAEERQYRPGEREIVSTFSEKIWLAYFMGLVGPNARKDLDRIRNIRNECAHDMNPITFEGGEVSRHCKELQLGKRTIRPFGAPNPREMFAATVQALASSMIIRATTRRFHVERIDEEERRPTTDEVDDWIEE